MINQVQLGFRTNAVFTHTMKDVYSALEYKLAQSQKQNINVRSSVTLDSYDPNNKSLETLQNALEQDVSLTEL